MSLIYVSSTYRDLIEHRKAVFEAVRRAQHEPIGMEDYQATEQPPLDRCLDDVRRCRAYIGVIGWRYGYIPQGFDHSITHLEYEEAGRCKLHRMMLLTPEDNWPKSKRDKDAVAITRFREQIKSRHGINTFKNLDDLKYKVVSSIKKEIGEGIAIPPLLPYRCDRHEQYEDISGALTDTKNGSEAAYTSPLIYLIHGHESQSVNELIKCFREDATSSSSAPKDIAINWKKLPWPTETSIEAIRASFIRNLAKALGVPASLDVAGLAAKVKAHDEALIIHTRVYTDDWFLESSLALRYFVEFWLNLPIGARRFPVIILISVEYRDAKTMLQRFTIGRRNKTVRNALVDLAARYSSQKNFVFVRELDDIRLYHAEEWSEIESVQRLLNGSDIKEEIASAYGSRTRKPMRPLAKDLLSILTRNSV